MISTIFSYLLLGISLSAPVGPINVAQINKGIKNGFLSAISTVGKEQALLYSIIIFVGIMIWDLFMATSIHFGRKFVNNRMMKWIVIFAGIVLVGFGMYFGYEAIKGIGDLI
ncbi:LysE family transporter [Paenibacillus sp. 102]|uniref:LysE family transporter n=1 Tax=Paenibacillus sp. 102 TaxID=3120823 RepID=UPI0031BBCD96